MVENKHKSSVFVGLSGGVDSSVAALLLKKQGYDVTGVFIKSYNLDGCAERDSSDARLVASRLNIPFYVFDFEKEYKREVVEYMVREYRDGRTPNPDVMCNKHIKFGLFLEKARSLGADYIATGHYVRLNRITPRKRRDSLPANESASLSAADSGRWPETKLGRLRDVPRSNPISPRFFLYEAKDKNKDQSYFLWTLTQEQLKYCLFPIGDYLKSEVRAMAKEAGLPTAEKKDSQGICFLGKVTLEDFLKKYIPEKRGAVLTTDGRLIGEHAGVQFYTIGQRHGLDLREKNVALGFKARSRTKPHYIAAKDAATNTIVVAEGSNNPALYQKEVELTDVNLLNNELGIMNKGEITVMARVRYRQPLVSAKLIIHDSKFIIRFDQPVKFVAPGQSAVFYLPAEASAKAGRSGLGVVGGGVIL